MRLYSFLDVRGPCGPFPYVSPLTIHGRENIRLRAFRVLFQPCRHLDPIVLGYSSLYRAVGSWRRKNFSRYPFRFPDPTLGGFPVKRNKWDETAIQSFVDHVRNDKPLVLFPKARDLDGELLTPKKGWGNFCRCHGCR